MRNVFAPIVACCVLASGAAYAGSAEKGKIAFVKNGCWQCHGFQGQGSVATSNSAVLSNTAMPFEAFESFVRSTNRAMPPFSEKILSNGDLEDIHAYLQSGTEATRM